METTPQPSFKFKWKIDWRDIIKNPLNYIGLFTNAVMLLGLVFLHWDGKIIVAAYFLESVIIGVFNIFKMTAIMLYNPKPNDDSQTGLQGWGLIPFFMVHYGFFISVQLVVFSGFLSIGGQSGKHYGLFSAAPHYFVDSLGDQLGLIAGNFVLGQSLSFVSVFLVKRQYLNTSMGVQMFQPYPRIFVQQFTVIIGAFAMMAFQSAMVIPYLLVAFKTFAELAMHQFETTMINNK